MKKALSAQELRFQTKINTSNQIFSIAINIANNWSCRKYIANAKNIKNVKKC